MNLVWMGLIAVIAFAERMLPSGTVVTWVVGLALILVGTMLVLAPAALSG